MEDEGKSNGGITKVCPNPKCGKIIFSEGNFYGFGWVKIKCGDCGEKVRIYFGMKTFVKVTIIAVIIVCVVFNTFSSIKAKKYLITCSSFNSQVAAQALFNTNPLKYQNLDRDNDRLACEINY